MRIAEFRESSDLRTQTAKREVFFSLHVCFSVLEAILYTNAIELFSRQVRT
jgi:hypothetical protein